MIGSITSPPLYFMSDMSSSSFLPPSPSFPFPSPSSSAMEDMEKERKSSPSTTPSPSMTTSSSCSISSTTASIDNIKRKGLSSPEGSGYIGSLTKEQVMMLYQLWSMLIEFFNKPFEESNKRTEKVLAHIIWNESLSSLNSNTSATSSMSTSMTLQDSNPLAKEFWNQCSTEDPDVSLLRFLRARKWILFDAFDMVIDCLRWRFHSKVQEIVYSGEKLIKKEILQSGKSYFWNIDREGRLIGIINAKLHDRNAQTLEETSNFCIYQMELARRLLYPKIETVTIIFDLEDAPLASLDFAGSQFMIKCLQAFYPESMGKCLILNAPWIFWGFWKMVSGLLDPIVAAKVEFIKVESLSKYIEPERLEKRFNGKNSFIYNYIESDDPSSEDDCSLSGTDLSNLTENHLELLELEELQNQLLQITTKIYESIYQEYMSSELISERNKLKEKLCAKKRYLDRRRLPKTFYHRMGIIDQDYNVNWPTS